MSRPGLPERRSVRLRGYDYAAPGAYFVTLCVQHRRCLFGEIVEGRMRRSPIGEAAHRCWQRIPDHVPHVELDAFVIMPNHMHGILLLREEEAEAPEEGAALQREADAGLLQKADAGLLGSGTGVQLNARTSAAASPSASAAASPSASAAASPSASAAASPGAGGRQGSRSPAYYARISPAKNSLGVIVRTYKAAVTHWCRRNGHPAFAWHRSYYEHIIRHRRALERIRRYIAENPARWHAARYRPGQR